MVRSQRTRSGSHSIGNRRLSLATTVIASVLLLGSQAGHAVPLSLYGAGSLNVALAQVATDYTAATGVPVVTTFQPSGTIRQEIEAGTAHPDVFASADTGNPLALQQENLAGPVVNFASNRLVAVADTSLGLTSANLLSMLLDPTIKVGTSTPVFDPLGDYTEQVFAQADAIDPGAKATLDAKAERLIAGPSSPPVPAGQNSLVYFVDTTGQANIFLTYYTSAVAALALDANLQEVELPANLAVSAEYGETVLDGASAGAASLENYLLSPTAQAVLAANGFGPPASVPEPTTAVLLGAGLLCLVAATRIRKSSSQAAV
jgi:molybdate transport system substrate-binding protein